MNYGRFRYLANMISIRIGIMRQNNLNKKIDFFVFVNVMNRDGVLLIQNAFPINEYFIDREAFDHHNKHLTLPLDLIQFVENG